MPGHGIHSEPWGNVGQEDATYFRFITMFYHDLPERMFFVHGHNKAWHQVRMVGVGWTALSGCRTPAREIGRHAC